MFSSIKDDLKNAFAYGNMVNRLIIINVIVFVILALIEVFTRTTSIYPTLIDWIAMPGQPIELLYKPWTLVTSLFVHERFWHLLWNMVGLHLFGTIVGDLLNDKRILPNYILGGILGCVFYLVASILLSNVGSGGLIGASGAILGFAMIGAMVAPDYNVRLLLIGNVKLKYIVLVFIFIDILQSQGFHNAGGHYAHLGGLLYGSLFVYFLRRNQDLTNPFNRFFTKVSNIGAPAPVKSYRPVLKVEHSRERATVRVNQTTIVDNMSFDDRLDLILDKIKKVGYDKLSKEEKEFLNQASKK